MAGVADKPFRLPCKRLGAGLAASAMTTSDPRLWNTRKSRTRTDQAGEPDPVSVQIAGTVPLVMAEAARYNAGRGAQIIDIAPCRLRAKPGDTRNPRGCWIRGHSGPATDAGTRPVTHSGRPGHRP